ncbi:MAG TPA: DUF1990 domain-containing protein [Blastocatellia bacterium]|nr:DUF1990 domain-containing protein [Blastocatellia bacterium]
MRRSGADFLAMFLRTRPSNEFAKRFIDFQRNLDFSYSTAAADHMAAPRGYTIDHNRIELGEGEEVFARAIAAIKRWEMFNIGWLELLWPEAPIQEGTTVAVLAHHLGFWSLNACRIVSVIEEEGPRREFGFVYGTLPDHAERGQERFAVEWDRESGKVFYDILAYSRPNKLLARLGYPFTRALQKRFARDSMQAMVLAVRQ